MATGMATGTATGMASVSRPSIRECHTELSTMGRRPGRRGQAGRCTGRRGLAGRRGRAGRCPERCGLANQNGSGELCRLSMPEIMSSHMTLSHTLQAATPLQLATPLITLTNLPSPQRVPTSRERGAYRCRTCHNGRLPLQLRHYQNQTTPLSHSQPRPHPTVRLTTPTLQTSCVP